MRDSARYAKIVEWSEEDQCFVGSADVLGLEPGVALVDAASSSRSKGSPSPSSAATPW